MPTYEQLACWCAAYNVSLTRDCFYVRATAYDMSNQPISTCTTLRKVETLPSHEDDFQFALDACDDLAAELLILKPSVAAKLNS